MARKGNDRNEGISSIGLAVVLLPVLLVVGVDGVSAVIGYTCVALLFIIGVVKLIRGRATR